MDLDTWASIGGLVVVFLALYGATTRSANRNHEVAMAAIERMQVAVDRTQAAVDRAQAAVDRTQTAVDRTQESLMTIINSNHAEVLSRLNVLEQRTYDIAVQMAPPSPERRTS